MKNPLNKRFSRQLRQHFGKYLVIFVFLILFIAMVSGFLVTEQSVYQTWLDGKTENNLEWGHFSLSKEPDESFIEELEKKADVTIVNQSYAEADLDGDGPTIRVYALRERVNLTSLFEGSYPANANEIALDRLFAANEGLSVGDVLTLDGRELTLTGTVALADYSSLFENNSDMMFDAINFSVALMTEEGLDSLEGAKFVNSFAYLYNEAPLDDTEEKERSDAFLEDIKEALTDYDTEKLMAGDPDGVITLTDYLPRYLNQAINFTGEDMVGDEAMFIALCMIVIAILAFIFAIMATSTMMQESGTIGTLLASGYSRGELIRHYMVLPVVITLIGALLGNLIGYTLLVDFYKDVYFGSYSLAPYQNYFNVEAFILTTVIPIVLMLVITYIVIARKMRATPIQFLRGNFKKNEREGILKLSPKLSFLNRFRLRVLFSNIPVFLTMFVGILFGALILVFGLMFVPLLDDYAVLVQESMIAPYQYVLKSDAPTETPGAESYRMKSLKTTDDHFKTDDITVFGIAPESAYIDLSLNAGEVAVSENILEKYGLEIGESITLKEPYEDKTYTFVITASYPYDAGLAFFIPADDFESIFAADGSYGYFSNEKITDIEENQIYTLIEEEDLTKLSRQMVSSMGDFLTLFQGFGIILFVMIMYLLTKLLLERNVKSISMVKILGFSNLEIGSIYLAASFTSVLISLLAAVPISDQILRIIFQSYLYTEITGFIPYIISNSIFVEMVVIGIVAFIFVSLILLYKISKIPKSEALKGTE